MAADLNPWGLGAYSLLAEDVLTRYTNDILLINRQPSLDAHKALILIRVICNTLRATIIRCDSHTLTTNVSVNILALLFDHTPAPCWLYMERCALQTNHADMVNDLASLPDTQAFLM